MGGGGGETLVKKEMGSNMGVLFENRGDKNPLWTMLTVSKSITE